MDESRTPTLQQMKNSLDRWVEDICSHVPFTSLDKKAMLDIMRYMGINHSQQSPTLGYKPIDDLFSPTSEITYYDIGYRLIKDQLERENFKLPPDEKKMFFDGVMGWLYQNPPKSHDEEMNRVLLQYSERFGVDRLTRNFEQLFQRFKLLQSTARDAQKELVRNPTDKRESSYEDMFVQCHYHLEFRIRGIRELIPTFSPNVK